MAEFEYTPNGTVFWYGHDQIATLLEDVNAEVKFDDWGVAGATLPYSCDYDSAPGFVYECLYHPEFPWLKRKTGSIKREEANLGKVTLNYEGVPPQTNDRKYRLSGSTSSEPIETHPKFVTDIAGPVFFSISDGIVHNATAYPNSSAPTMYVGTNGASFDLKGQFLGFAQSVDGTTLNPFAGIKNYLMGSVMYEQIWTRGNTIGGPSDLDNLGYIDNPPDDFGLLPDVEDRTWLLLTAELEPIGFASRLTRKWRLSGYRGWNNVIYTAP